MSVGLVVHISLNGGPDGQSECELCQLSSEWVLVLGDHTLLLNRLHVLISKHILSLLVHMHDVPHLWEWETQDGSSPAQPCPNGWPMLCNERNLARVTVVDSWRSFTPTQITIFNANTNCSFDVGSSRTTSWNFAPLKE